jgi:hypothetical protein
MISNKCENCDFWVRIDDNGGKCCRYPPYAYPQAVQPLNRVVGMRPLPVGFMDIISWPKTKCDDWCGEFMCGDIKNE